MLIFAFLIPLQILIIAYVVKKPLRFSHRSKKRMQSMARFEVKILFHVFSVRPMPKNVTKLNMLVIIETCLWDQRSLHHWLNSSITQFVNYNYIKYLSKD